MQILRWPFQQRQWSQKRRAKPNHTAAVDEASLQPYRVAALSVADAQQRDAEAIREAGSRSISMVTDAIASVHIEWDNDVQHIKGHWQASSDLEMLRRHVPPSEDDLVDISDIFEIFDPDGLMQSCNSLTPTLARDRRNAPGYREDASSISHDAQRPYSLHETGASSMWCQSDEQADEHAIGTNNERLEADHDTSKNASAKYQSEAEAVWRRKRMVSLGNRGAPINGRGSFSLAAEAGMTREELALAGYTDCDLSYLVG